MKNIFARKFSKKTLSAAVFMLVFGLAAVVFAATQDYVYTDTYSYPNGILVFTYADNGGASISGNAAITKGDNINYYLEITNQGDTPRIIDLKFKIPKGYVFNPNITGGVSCATITPCGNPTSYTLGGTTSSYTGGPITGPVTITWSSITVPAGTSRVSFKLGT